LRKWQVGTKTWHQFFADPESFFIFIFTAAPIWQMSLHRKVLIFMDIQDLKDFSKKKN
jgi:hypothetical protein